MLVKHIRPERMQLFPQRVVLTLTLLCILVVAAYLRLWRISEYMTFLGDEGRDVLVVKRMIVDGKFTLLGPTASVGGFFLGPIYYYFMLPFLWVWRLDPTGPAVMVALFGIATVYVVYKIGKDFFSPWVGLLASSLYAVSPVVIAFSRSSWNPNVVQFFSALLIYLLWSLVKNPTRITFMLVGATIGIGLQLHYLFSFLAVLTAVWVFLLRKKYPVIYGALLILAGFVVGYAPFLLFELRHGFPNTQTLLRFLLEGKDTGFSLSNYIKTINDVTFRLFGRLLFRFPQQEWWDRYSLVTQRIWVHAIRATIVLGFLSAVQILRNKGLSYMSAQGAKLLLWWYVVVVGLFGLYRRGIYDYYFGVFFALPFLLFGLSLWRLGRFHWVAKILSMGLFIFLLFFNWQGRPYAFAPNMQLAQAKTIAQAAMEKAGGKPFNFALITGNNSDHAYRYFFEIWGNAPITIENEVIDPARKTVTDQLIVICELPKTECAPLGHPLWEIAGFGQAEIVDTWAVPFVTIFKLAHLKQ